MDKDDAKNRATAKLNELAAKSTELASDVKGKSQEFLTDHDPKVEAAIDKTAGFVDEKTKGRYTDTITNAAARAKATVDKLAGKPGSDGVGESEQTSDPEPEPQPDPEVGQVLEPEVGPASDAVAKQDPDGQTI